MHDLDALLRTTGRVVDAVVDARPLALRRPIRGARGSVATRTIRLLRLTADDACTGVGEASVVDWLAASAADGSDDALASLVGSIRRDVPAAGTLLRWSLDASRPSSVRAALQTALLDLEARRRGCTVAHLLGGAAACAELALSALIPDDEPAAMAKAAASYAARGLASFKVKVGRPDARDDVARVAAVRDAIGRDARLRLDANGAWNKPDAELALQSLSAGNAEFVEEPLRDAGAIAALRCPMPVALDESVRNADDLARALAVGGFRTLVLKLERVGGPLPALAMAITAMRAGIEVVFTDSIESVVGRAAAVHVAAAAAHRGGKAASAVGLGGRFLLDDGDGDAVAVPRNDHDALGPEDHRSTATGDRQASLSTAAVRGPGLGIDAGRFGAKQ